MNSIKIYLSLALLLFSHLGRAQDDRSWFQRQWDDMIAHYNIYFNAEQKFQKATDDLFESHKDDFDKFIEVYPYGDEAAAKNMRAPMDEVMKKASKVIQTKPMSNWTDDAYFLIGQTHFFADDPFSAIETFQFVYSNYSDPLMKAKAQHWVMKSYVRQEKYNDAEAILGLIRENEFPDRRLKAATHLVAGDLFVKQEKYAQAVEELEKGAEMVKDRQLCYRAYYLLGQVCLETGQYDKASTYFQKVIRITTPYEFDFHANMGLTNVTQRSGGKGLKLTQRNLKRMLKDDKNIEYFDQIYYELALLSFVEGDEPQGLEYLMLSSRNAGSNAGQKTKTYLFLAEYFFENAAYDRSQKYYDSAVAVLPQEYPNYEGITAKHATLSTLIEHVQTIQLQDSLLALAALSKDELDRRIDQIIEAEKRQEQLAREQEEIERQRNLLNRDNTDVMAGSSGGVWYFYNAAQVGRGANEFERKWGRRKHADWWRFTNKSVVEETVVEEETEDPDIYDPDADEEQQEILESVSPDRRKYYEDIPFSSTAKLVANSEIRTALLEVGKIYYDDLREYSMSRQYLKQLFKRYPENENEAEALFYLAKTHREQGDTATYDSIALVISKRHPETPYNSIMNSKEIVETGEDAEVIALYEQMYAAYVREDYDAVARLRDSAASAYPANAIQAKYDYLYALTIGKTAGREAYLEELQAITENYPGTEIATRAAFTITSLTQEAERESHDLSMFTPVEGVPHFYVITGTVEDPAVMEQQLNEYNERFHPAANLKVTRIIFEEEHMFYIKLFDNEKQAMEYHLEMAGNKNFLYENGMGSVQLYPITNPNFKALVKHKNEESYLLFFKDNYPSAL